MGSYRLIIVMTVFNTENIGPAHTATRKEIKIYYLKINKKSYGKNSHLKSLKVKLDLYMNQLVKAI